ncbi:sugar phosphate isomerase/epimerase family protein [Oscillospiraceae bacterium MB08-C2-2]|nr:sugar phosphate isomerase/epimerase family protein [Oscillospiraceae bacterium MB08-C2-2]
MKIGFNEGTAMGCSTLEQDLLLCEKAGFDYIEIRLDMLREYLKTHTLAELRHFFDSSHLKPHAINALYIYSDLFSNRDDSARREALLSEFHFGCQAAQAIGSRNFIVVPPLGESIINPDTAQVNADCVRILGALGEIGESYGIRLSFELVGLDQSSVRSIAQANEIVTQVNRENVGFVFDSANIYINGKVNDFSEMASVEPSKIFAVHINDFSDIPQAEFDKKHRCFCGEGVIDLENYLYVLKRIGYNDMVSVETFRPEYWAKSPQWVIQTAYFTTLAVLQKYGCLTG